MSEYDLSKFSEDDLKKFGLDPFPFTQKIEACLDEICRLRAENERQKATITDLRNRNFAVAGIQLGLDHK